MEESNENSEKTYIVTQMINPNYFHLFNPFLRDDKLREMTEKSLEEEITRFKATAGNKSLNKGDTVAFYWVDGKRYIRCELDDIILFNNVNHYFLFSLDYGVSLYTTKVEDIHPISEVIRFVRTPIMNKISLSVLPAITRFDYIENKEVFLFNNTWCDLALKLFKHSLDEASIINFEICNDLPGYQGFLYGDLIITNFYGIKFSLCETLINAKVAKKASSPQEFFKYFDRVIAKDIQRWNDNKKTGGILKYIEGALPLNYEDEIIIKDYITKSDDVQEKIKSVQKVIEWQQKNEIYNRMIPGDETESEMIDNEEYSDWNLPSTAQNDQEIKKHEDEGFDEIFENQKRKPKFSINPSKFNFSKKLKFDNPEKVSVVSGISISVSQIVPQTEQ